MKESILGSQASNRVACSMAARCVLAELCKPPNSMTRGLECRRTIVSKGAMIGQGHQGDSLVFVIKSGVVRSVACWPDGETSTFCIYGPGTVLSLLELFALFGSSSYFLESISRCELCVIPQESVLSAIRRDPSMASAVVCAMGNALSACGVYTRLMSQPRAGDRIRLLLAMLEEMGEHTKEGIELTHEEIASLICSDRVTVTRALRQLSRQGCVSLGYRNVRAIGSLRDTDQPLTVTVFPRPHWQSVPGVW